MLTKPNILRLVCFVVFFAGALYYPVREVLYYKLEKPQEFRYRISGAALNDFDLRPKVPERGRWKWVEYIFPRTEADKLRLDILPSTDPDAPKKLNFVYYPMSRKFAKEILPQVESGRAELVIERYPNGRLHIGRLLIDGQPVTEQKVGAK